jgi:hypothetical protein
MEQHGSEPFFVLGEGLLGETVGGREPKLATAAAAPDLPHVDLLLFAFEGKKSLLAPLG